MTPRPPTRCSRSTTIGSSSSAGTIRAASSASRACPTETSTRRAKRSTAWGSPPYGELDGAVKEIYRGAKLGLRGMELSCSWDMEPMWHPVWEPLWKAVNDVSLPLHFHTFPALPPGKLDTQKGLTRRAAFFTVVSGFQMNLVNILAAIVGAAVLERYPNVRIAFGESGIGWNPHAPDRMDFEWEDRFRDLGLTMKPSDYWRRQCKGTFQFDRIGTKLIEDMGVV